ncbi:recombinase family protein [Aeromonas veronii]|uniref:recombinase family protein n=1 Tax=Aeromonas TaxID=642 RepID=UPI0019201B45|nr:MULTISPECIES: recombinase family protein [Aeromonas]MBL0601337.1 recombinase family protein [Aeromonas dhakensis]WDA23069.1 recombinase family protein [Aeromonas hydrophila]WES93132.1 recombinase family protein [Aeromonas hydrophila]
MSHPPKAYSYIRFSTPKQAQGDSYRRQLAKAKEYCTEHNLTLVEDTIDDRGVSAFRGANMMEGALGRFLEAVKSGVIEQGSYLLVESVDRLSRQAVEEALGQFLGLINAGVVVVTLDDKAVYRKGQVETQNLLLSIMFMVRANNESETKSDRSREAWEKGRKQARENNKVMKNSRLPSWLEWEEGKIVPIAERVAIVNEMFEMAKSGCGYEQIAKAFRSKGYKTFGKMTDWRPAGIQAVIKSRAVIGEFQPHIIEKGERIPDGEPIVGYYPAIVSRSLFKDVHHIISQRNNHSGSYRKGRFNNLFSGVLRCQCGEPLRFNNKGKAGSPRNYLICPMRQVAGCKLPNLLHEKIELQLLQAASLLSEVMKQRRPEDAKTVALKEELAELQMQLEIGIKKRKKAAESMVDNDDDADFREIFLSHKANCQALEEHIAQLESEIMDRELSQKTLGRLIQPKDLKSTEQRQQFNAQLKAVLQEIRLHYDGFDLAAVFKDIDGSIVLEQAFKPKLAGSSVRDLSGEELLRTTSEAPYIDAAWVKGETDEYESHRKDASSGLDDEFEDLSLQESK